MTPSILSQEQVITGNHAVSYGVWLARAEVISAYPITPQTQVVELLSKLCEEGFLKARFLKVESEHSALAALVGASTMGVRTFTATSSHGLALMHEMLHWAAGARLPIVLADVNRALGAPWSIWTDQTDSLAQRDTGWIQLYCESNQEVLDNVLLAYRLAEAVRLPAMLVLDAFVLSHTAEPVSIPSPEMVDRFLPPYRPPDRLSTGRPTAISGLAMPDRYMEFRFRMQAAMGKVLEVLPEIEAEFADLFGRRYGAVERYRMDGAKLALVTSGTITSTAREVVDELRAEGRPVGLVKIRLFRPFPAAELRAALSETKRVAVLDRNVGLGVGGIFAQELRAALYGYLQLAVSGFILGLGGRDVTPAVIREAAERAWASDEGEESVWLGVHL
jgi:pyruvate/2-oxoacid:ferredoxin oxidoreductase alpha subunit